MHTFFPNWEIPLAFPFWEVHRYLMRLVTWRPLKEAIDKHPGAGSSLRAWRTHVERADWSSFADVIGFSRTASSVGDRVVFNIGGNNYRLVVIVEYKLKLVFVRWFGTHAEYDRIDVRSV